MHVLGLTATNKIHIVQWHNRTHSAKTLRLISPKTSNANWLKLHSLADKSLKNTDGEISLNMVW